MTARPLASAAIALTLFFAVGPGVTGNDTGGMIPWSPSNEDAAPELASGHCAHYGKFARVTDGVRQPGYFINFICAHNYGQRYYGAPVHFWPSRR